ncbi:MAG: uracil-DNA glycosylase [Clostridia bacterium]|nr:uracil-DNA glycosylase [Clostridia bacterium]
MVNFGNDWDEVLKGEFDKEYYLSLRRFLAEEYRTQTIYPPMHDIFNAFKKTAYKDVKVCIIGQDPYFRPGQAHGMCFSVKKGVPLPPSLRNIYKELESDLGIPPSKDGYLEKWAEQGVLLLNTVLTVREGQPLSHKDKGWEIFTDDVLKKLNEKTTPIVFILWGSPAKKKAEIITSPIHKKLTAPHPSPMSASYGFFGCRHFSKANAFLIEQGLEPVNWDLNDCPPILK